MSVASNKESIRRLFAEALNRGELAVIDEVFAPDLIDHEAGADDLPGPAGIIDFVQMIRRTFPDLAVTIDLLIGEGDHVASVETWRGTHALTRQPAQGATLHVFTFRDGQVIEEWSKGWEWLDGIELL
jgi:ketosteroid isomerase-like protein